MSRFHPRRGAMNKDELKGKAENLKGRMKDAAGALREKVGKAERKVSEELDREKTGEETDDE
jgi:uncharacterized protein YjbJ (UPF0337 family)